MGIGSSRGADRAIKAAELAIASPLLESSIEGAQGVLLSIQGGSNLGLYEISDAAKLVEEAVHPDANIIFGAVIDDSLGDEVRVTVIAAGFEENQQKRSAGVIDDEADVAPEPVGAVPPAEESWLLPQGQDPVSDPAPVFAQEVPDDGELDVPDFLR
jgi:cell division protein FtsZ